MHSTIGKLPKNRDLLKICLQKYFDADDKEFQAFVESRCEYLDLLPNEILLKQGEQNDDVYFVLSGRLKAIISYGETEEQVLGEIGRGETVGELALFTEEPRSATVVATRNSVVGKLTRDSLEQALSKHPGVAITITRQIISRFRRNENKIRPPSVPISIAVIGLGLSDAELSDFAQNFVEARKVHSKKVRSITLKDVQHFGFEADYSDVSAPGSEVSVFLSEQELSNDAVFLVTNQENHAWTKTAIHQADEIVLVANANTNSDPYPVERELLVGSDAPPVKRTLILLQDETIKSPNNTSSWLSNRRVDRHFHIRPNLEKDWRRLGRIYSGKAIGLVLSGGGARGYAHVGIIQALSEAGIDFDFIGGTSIGAVIGTWICMDIAGQDMREQVKYAFQESPFGNLTGDFHPLPIVSLIKGRRAKSIINEMLQKMTSGDIDFEDSWKTFFVVASNYSRQREEVLTHGNFLNNMMSSFAIPGLFPPRIINNEIMYDGGSFNNFPIDVMRQLGASRVIGIDLLTDQVRQVDFEELPGPVSIFFDRFRSKKKRKYRLPAIPDTLLTASFVTSMNRQREMRSMVDMLFKAEVRGVGMLDWKKFDDVVERNYELAKQQLDQLKAEELQDWCV